MGDWWSYGLSDFLLFSPRTYFRLIEIHNEALWPSQIAALSGGLLVAILYLRQDRVAQHMLPSLLAMAWLWVGWAWLLERYVTINWAADVLAIAFMAQAALLLVLAWAGPPVQVVGWRRWLGLSLILFGLALYPLIAPALGRGWGKSELFAIMPDPTVAVTAGAIAGTRGWLAKLALVIPLAWCCLSGTTLLAMDEPDAFVLPLVGLLALAAAGAGILHRGQAAATT